MDWTGWHQIYTDASKRSNTNCVGVGVYHSQYKIVQKIKLPPETSVYTGECYGLFKAIEYVLLLHLSKAIIFCDSLSSLQSLQRYPFKSHKQPPIIFDIRKLLYLCLSRGYRVVFAWIPSHVGISGNENADRLANEAIQVGDVRPYNNYCQDLVSLAKLYLHDAWNELWVDGAAAAKGKYYRLIQESIPRKPWFSNLQFNKRITSVLCRLRLGHVCTPAHLFKFKIVDDPLCSCGEYGDLNHIFFSCTLYDRSAFVSQLLSIRIPFPTSIICLLYYNDPDVYKILAKFIDNNDIKV